MIYHLDFLEKAEADIEFHKKSGNKSVLKKLLILLNELEKHPYEGTGKPEALKHALSTYWSRRINGEHRLVYKVEADVVSIHSAKDHY